ncbi:MAG: HlyD family efflux transporter periplasmic adaptor subunit, partial [Myxococcales bacterium]|nr:HlyD family efflux transporter periplasmic adaptor subunit [Myxococcales bacterium]
EVGQVVGPQSPVVTLVGTDRFWVQVSVPVNHLAWISVPGRNGTEGSKALVRHTSGEQVVERIGHVVRMLGDLDPVGRMARLLVEIEDPLRLNKDEPGLPLLLGAYVEVRIEGQEVEDVIEIPRSTLQEGNQVYVMTPKNLLDIRSVTVPWRTEDTVWVSKGLSTGDRVITSRIPLALRGMTLRLATAPSETSAIAPTEAQEAPTP